MVKCGFEERSVLLTGDYANDLIQIPSGCLRSEILKFPHHGARLSGAGDFLDGVSPQVTIISVGERNQYGHPDADNIFLIREMKSKIYRTDQHGAITITFEKGRTVVRTMLD